MVRSLAFFVPVLVLGASSLALAQQRVVVEPFSGPRGAAVRSDVIESLEEAGVQVVDDAEVRAAADRLGIGRRPEDAQYVELGRALRVSAFIDGSVRRQRRSWAATVRVRNAANGERVGNASWGGRTAASLNGARRNAHSRLSSALASTTVPGAAPAAANTGNPAWYNAQDDERPPGGEDETEEPAPAPPRPTSTRYDAFRISVNGGTLWRGMSTPVMVYGDGSEGVQCEDPETSGSPADPARFCEIEQRSYQSGGIGHFELGGAAEIYPGAFGDQPFPYLGLAVSFSHSIGVQSNGTDRNTGLNVPVPTEQLDFYIGARGRYRFGEDRREPEIRIDAGWGTFLFNLGLAELQLIELDSIVPPMQHGYVYLGAGISYGLVPTYLTVALDVGARIGTNIGGDTRNVWGTRTGPSNGFGFGVELRTEIPEIAQGIFAALRIQYFLFSTDFNGQVGCAAEMACAGYVDPWADDRLWQVWPVTPPAAGERANVDDAIGGPTGAVTDNYVRLQLAIGYAFY